MLKKICKLASIKGFAYGAIAGAVTGIINTAFFNIPHLGAIVFITIWGVFDTKTNN
jgi:hypothetical protein